MRNPTLIGLVLAVATVTAAVAAPPPLAPLPEGSTDGIVYFYRPDRLERRGKKALFRIDGTASIQMNNNDCTALRVPAGAHRLQIEWIAKGPSFGTGLQPLEQTITVEPGKSYYYRFESQVTGPSTSAPLSYSLDMRSRIIAAEPAMARQEMARCEFIPPLTRFDAVSPRIP